MSHLHKHNILHRDLKSLNVLVNSTNPNDQVCAKLVDFGDSRESFRYSDENQICGTVRWTAPEVFNGKPFTQKSDVFSFGIILWEMICLEIPYPDIKRDFQVEDFVLSGGRPPVSVECPAGYRALMQSCWDENPQYRPTFGQILDVLWELQSRL